MSALRLPWADDNLSRRIRRQTVILRHADFQTEAVTLHAYADGWELWRGEDRLAAASTSGLNLAKKAAEAWLGTLGSKGAAALGFRHPLPPEPD